MSLISRHRLAPGQIPSIRLARAVCLCGLLIGFTAAAQAQLSKKIHEEVAAAFPQFAVQPAKQVSPNAGGTPAPLSDDPLELLPDYHVRGTRVPDKDPDLWLSRRAKKDKSMIEYYQSMTDLEWALNGWHIPLPFGYSLTPSAQTRANAVHFEKKIIKELHHLSALATSLAVLDSAEAKKLLHDLDLSSHPGR